MGVVASVTGSGHIWSTRPGDDENRPALRDFTIAATKSVDGSVGGHYNLVTASGLDVKGTVTCLNVVGNRAFVGATWESNPEFPFEIVGVALEFVDGGNGQEAIDAILRRCQRGSRDTDRSGIDSGRPRENEFRTRHGREEILGNLTHAWAARVLRALPVVWLLCLPHSLPAQEPGEDGPPPCSSDEFRAFDFWLGEWEVSNPEGDVVGENTIRAVLDGCALEENWRGASGSVGRSLNLYDARTGKWHQTWVDNSGLLLRLDGGLVDGSMVLEGELRERDGRTRLHRITWTPGPDGTVRQHWERSEDDGQTWSTVFDGTYTPAEE